MNLLKTIYDRLHPAPPAGVPLSTPETHAEAENALAKANTDLNEIIQQEPVVTAITGKLRSQMYQNHFTELVEASMSPIKRRA